MMTAFTVSLDRTKLSATAGVLCVLALCLQTGCSGRSYLGSTPVVKKQAKRAYNKIYKIKGKKYRPQSIYEYSQKGIASYYGGTDVFHGRKTSTGEIFDKNGLTAAHKTLPLPSIVRVTNLKNGRSMKLRINDRGPFVDGRIIDVSEKAAKLLGFHRDGVAKVRVDCLVGESMMLAHRYVPHKSNPYTLYGDYPRKMYGPVTATNTVSVTQMVNHKLSEMTQKATSAKSSLNQPSQPSQLSKTWDAPPHKPRHITPYSPQDVQGRVPVHSSESAPATALPRGTYIQVGTYASQQNANNFAFKVQTRMRVTCKPYKIEHSKPELYRVLVGPMESKGATEKMLHELKIRNVTDAFVVVQK